MNEDKLAPRELVGFGLRPATGTALIPAPSVSDIAPEVRPVSQNPAEVLATLMDFPGSVALAELLEEPLPRGAPNPRASLLGQRLLEDVRARLDALEPLALKPLLGRRAPALLAPHEYVEILQRHGFRGRPETACSDTQEDAPQPQPTVESLRGLMDELGIPFGSALSTSLRQAQAHIATLRWEIAHDIRGLGSVADRLERIDAALTRAMQVKMGELLDRMEHAAQLTFERACTHALLELPEGYGEQDLDEWSEENGWLGRFRERCIRMTKALFGHLRRGLEGLLRSALQAEAGAADLGQYGDEAGGYAREHEWEDT